jgi:signal recognition particle subunit SRP54
MFCNYSNLIVRGLLAASLLAVSTDAFLSPNVVAHHGSSPLTSSSAWATPRTTAKSTTRRLMFDQLSQAISDVAKNFGVKQRMTEASIKDALRQVRRALLDADVNVDVADTLIEGVRKRSLGTEVIEGVTAEQQFIKAMYDELLDMMGGDSTITPDEQSMLAAPVARLATGSASRPAIILLAGLQGAGKTTAAGKLALYLKEREVDYDKVEEMGEEAKNLLAARLPKRERKVLLIAADVYRPAAIKQLQILGESIGVEVFSQGTEADPVDIVREGIQKSIDEGFDTVIVDTAGRQVVDANLMEELRLIKSVSNAQETLLVVDAMTGQEAASLTAAFDSAVGLTGAVLTKMDGDSRGGAAVSVRGVSGKPIKFVGTGEKTSDLEPFYPARMASRILGMGDVVSLVEKAAAQVSDADALKMQQKMTDASFDFDDFLQQTELVANMGSVAGITKLMPGMGGQLSSKKILEVEARLKKSSSMICSMTKKERANPELLITDVAARRRLLRITRGSGMPLDEGVNFISDFQRMRTMMSRMQKQMGGQDPNGAPDGSNMEEMLPAMGNRAMRRNAKKKRGGARGGGGGFG